MKHEEIPFMRHLMIALGSRPELRIHRQNCGSVPVRNRTGKVVRHFDAGPPNGAADISGIVRGSGRRIEIETKAEDGELSPAQERWRDMIVEFGGIHVTITYDESKTLESNIDDSVSRILEAIEA